MPARRDSSFPHPVVPRTPVGSFLLACHPSEEASANLQAPVYEHLAHSSPTFLRGVEVAPET